MGKTLMILKIRNSAGATIGEIALEEPDGPSPAIKPPRVSTRQQNLPDYDDSFEAKPVTDAQKRMLYRLALKLGHQGDAAREFIESRLSAFGNGKPDRKTASYLIDKLQGEVKNNGDGGSHAAA
jgi:hypothetical protein